MSCRIRCAGIYVEEEKILLVKHKKNNREYYLLPGGGQEQGESLPQTLVREWKEELDVNIEVGDLLFCGESFTPKTDSGGKARHVMQVVFAVKKIEGNIKVISDGTLFDFAWMPIRDLQNIMLFPKATEQILSYVRTQENLKNFKVEKKYMLYEWIP